MRIVIIFRGTTKSSLVECCHVSYKKTFSMQKQTSSPNIECVKRQVKLLYNHEKTKIHSIWEKEDKFEKRRGMLIDYYDEITNIWLIIRIVVSLLFSNVKVIWYLHCSLIHKTTDE